MTEVTFNTATRAILSSVRILYGELMNAVLTPTRRPRAVILALLVAGFLLDVALLLWREYAGHAGLVTKIIVTDLVLASTIAIWITVLRPRVVGRISKTGEELDVPEGIRDALATDGLATEVSIFYYALASWRRKPFVPAGATAFSYHKKNGYAGILYTLARMSLVEMVAIDFLIRVSHPTAANIVLAVDLFAAAWLLGFARAVQLRPILVVAKELRIRMGLQWSLDVPMTNIASAEYGRVKAPPKKTPGYLRMAPQPNAILTLREPMVARGVYGMKRTVERVGLAIDDVKAFEAALKNSTGVSA
jgi:hypothetical protein